MCVLAQVDDQGEHAPGGEKGTTLSGIGPAIDS